MTLVLVDRGSAPRLTGWVECVKPSDPARNERRVLALASAPSIDQGPGPAINKKSAHMICAYSDRTSCNTAQMPTCGGAGGSGSGDVPRYSAIFVVSIATTISITKGI